MHSPETHEPATAHAARPPSAVAVLYAGGLVYGLVIASIPASGAVLKALHDLTDAQYGALFLPQVAAAIAGSVAGARAARTLGLRRLLAAALAAAALSQALLASAIFVSGARAAPCILLGATVLGFGFGLSGAPLNALPALLFPRRADSALVALHTLLGLGLGLAPVAAHAFAAARRWHAFPATLAAAALVLAWVAARAPLPAHPSAAHAPPADAGPRAEWRALLPYVAIALLYALAEGTLSNWAVLYVRETQGLPHASAAAALAAFWAGMVTGRLATSIVLLDVEPVRIWLALPAAMALAFLLLPGARTPALAVAAFAFAGVACSSFFPLTVGRAVARLPAQAPRAAALLTAALMLGIGVGTWAVGLARGALPMETIYRLSALWPLAALALAAAAARSARTPRAPAAQPALILPRMQTPATLGYRMPPEWAPHQATWLSWPHNRASWPGAFEGVEPVMAQAVAALATGETVHINVLDADHEAHVRALLDPQALARVRFHHFPTNDAWCRDHGAIFVTRPASRGAPLAALHFDYNAWGGKYPPFDRDREIGRLMAEALDVPRFVGGMILEGGSIEVNGAGTLLTTEQCLLNPNRNPHMSREEIEQRLRDTLGVTQIVWLGEGIEGDDTDGHVDDLTRFVAEDAVVTVVEPNPDDANHAPLAANLERLRAVRLPDGRALRIHEIPLPAPLVHEGQRLPASYANFYIGNRVVLLPVFDDPNDARAIEVLQRCFPDRRVVALDCRRLVVGLGTFHCLTQQLPAADGG